MQELAAAILKKYDVTHSGLTQLGGRTNTSWRVESTELVVRVAPDSLDNGNLQQTLRAADVLTRAGVRFVTPAFPLVIQTITKAGDFARGTLWFYEPETGEKTDYHQLGQVVRHLQEVGTEAMISNAVDLPNALSMSDLRGELKFLVENDLVEPAIHDLLASWLPRIEKGLHRLPEAKRTVVHDDLWAKNTIMTPTRGLVLCDPDNLAWGRADYDLAFISRGRELGVISKAEVQAFEAGYGGKIPDITNAWRMAMFHRFRWVCHLIEQQASNPNAADKLRAELTLWRRKRGPQPG